MSRVNIRELHRHTGAVIDRAAHGEVIIIEKRGLPVAEIRPASVAAPGFPKEFWRKLERLPKMQDDSGRLISEDRDRM
jgi:prevent-host-death family protein